MNEHDTTELAIANVVANIDGVSDRVIDGLDAEFGTATAVAEASPNELQRVDGIGPVLGRKIASRTSSARRNPEIHVLDDIYTKPQCSRQR